MEETHYLHKIQKELLNPGFQQEVFIKRTELDKEAAEFLLNVFWNKADWERVIEYVTQKRKELYQYSIEMGYIDKGTPIDKFEHFLGPPDTSFE